MPEYQCGHCAVEHAIAEKLKALVMGEAVATMGERLAQQLRPAEDVAKLLAKCVTVHILISGTQFGSFLFAIACSSRFADTSFRKTFLIFRPAAAFLSGLSAIQ